MNAGEVDEGVQFEVKSHWPTTFVVVCVTVNRRYRPGTELVVQGGDAHLIEIIVKRGDEGRLEAEEIEDEGGNLKHIGWLREYLYESM